MRDNRQANQAAYEKLKPLADRTYPTGQFVAIADGQIIADARDLKSLRSRVASLGKMPTETFVFQAGVHYPENATIFI